MSYLIDTDICIYWLKGNENIEQKALTVMLDNIYISCALVNDFTLVTNNERHFERIKGLKAENWIK